MGLAAAVYGVQLGWGVMIAAGMAALALGVVAVLRHHRLGEGPLRTRAARAKRLWAELATWAMAPPLAVVIMTLALHPRPSKTALEAAYETVSGKPIEVRSETRRVIMPGGRSYYFWCGSERRQRDDCPALRKWRELPRWPEPEHVEMRVNGNQILGLVMDGETIVDIQADTDDKGIRVILTLAGLGLTGAASVAIWRRLRQLAGLKRPGKTGGRASKGSPTPPASL